MDTAGDPKKLLDALLAGEPLPFAEDVRKNARALAREPATADPEAVGRLPEPLALAVLESAIRARAHALAEALAESRAKPLAKAAKKALYRLRSMGVALPERKAEPPPPPPAAPIEEPPPSLLSAISGNGERVLILARPLRGRVELLQMAISDEHGVVELRVGELSRGAHRKILKDARRAGSPAAIEISLEEAKAVLAEAAAANLRSHTAFPEGLDAALRHLGVAPADHPLEVPPPEGGDAALAARGAQLHEEPEIAAWLPPAEEIQKLALKVDEVATSSLYVDEGQRAQQLARTLHSVAEAFFTPNIRQLYGRRLWRMGELYQRLDRSAAAQLAQAEARRLYHAAPGLFSPFAVRLFEKVLRRARPRPGAHPETPTAARAEAASERRSPGGLILP